MSAEDKTARAQKRLNDLVAITVVMLSVFMAVSKIKDDNISQAMQRAKTDSVDAWAEYQAARIKLHLDETALNTLRLMQPVAGTDQDLARRHAGEYEADISKYQGRSAETMAKARAMEAEYDRLNLRGDQFDLSEAFLSISLALAAVSALVNVFWLLGIAWAAGAGGIVLGLAGFLGVSLRLEWLASLLGT